MKLGASKIDALHVDLLSVFNDQLKRSGKVRSEQPLAIEPDSEGWARTASGKLVDFNLTNKGDREFARRSRGGGLQPVYLLPGFDDLQSGPWAGWHEEWKSAGQVGKKASFGPGVDYAQTIKNYRSGAKQGPDHRYEPPRDPFITKKAIFGAPNLDRASTAYMERNNGTMRHFIGRMRRLVYAFSKDLDHHKVAVALGYVHYNLCHIVRTLRVTPAMAARVTDHVWELPELLDALAVPIAGPLAHRILVVDVKRQLDLLAWVAPPMKPRRYVQMGLFGIEIEPSGDGGKSG